MHTLKNLKPDREFVKRTERAFLSAFREKFPAPTLQKHGVLTYLLRGTAAAFTVVFILGGASVYADQKNVGPENVLYPLKRSHELLNLALTSDASRPELHLKLAERRLEEVSGIREKDPGNPKIHGLVKDLRNEIKNSFAAIKGEDVEFEAEEETEKQKSGFKEMEEKESLFQMTAPAAPPASSSAKSLLREDDEPEKEEREITEKIRVKNPKIVPICRSFKGILESGEEDIRELIEEHPEFLEKFEQTCLPIIKDD